MDLLEQIDRQRVPQHVAIIMDGNGRWAQQRGNKRLYGHENGVNAVRQATEAAGKAGVKYLTLYAFSTENWSRPKDEVEGLMLLLVESINTELQTLIKNGIQLRIIGQTQGLPLQVQQKLQVAIDKTAHCETLTLIVALNYGAHQELADAARQMAIDCLNGKLSPNDISPSTVQQYLYTASIPNPELMIRTSGEHRLSNFLLWQMAYSELHFTPVLWPDFTQDDFYKAIIDFQHRERRFGGTTSV